MGVPHDGVCRAGFLTTAGQAFAMIFVVFARPWRYPDSLDKSCIHKISKNDAYTLNNW